MQPNAIVHELHDAISRLADAVNDVPQVERALRRFAAELPLSSSRNALFSTSDLAPPPYPATARGAPVNPSAIRPLLYEALADGVLDARGFDKMMLTRARAARVIAARTRV